MVQCPTVLMSYTIFIHSYSFFITSAKEIMLSIAIVCEQENTKRAA